MELKERCVCGCSARRFISLCLEWLERRGGAWGNVNQSHYTKDRSQEEISSVRRGFLIVGDLTWFACPFLVGPAALSTENRLRLGLAGPQDSP